MKTVGREIGNLRLATWQSLFKDHDSSVQCLGRGDSLGCYRVCVRRRIQVLEVKSKWWMSVSWWLLSRGRSNELPSQLSRVYELGFPVLDLLTTAKLITSPKLV